MVNMTWVCHIAIVLYPNATYPSINLPNTDALCYAVDRSSAICTVPVNGGVPLITAINIKHIIDLELQPAISINLHEGEKKRERERLALALAVCACVYYC